VREAPGNARGPGYDSSIPGRKTVYRQLPYQIALGRVLDETQEALEQRLSRISLAQVIRTCTENTRPRGSGRLSSAREEQAK
jgi:hypothetical protein